jgi:kinetochore protein Spc7/SPC105
LKKYISEGRRIVHEIETETFEENPPLFREYMTASPEFKVLMDNQFKNVKTHARLLSKAMWYEWRMKLQDGLKEGLLKTAEGMDNDDKLLSKQQELISSILPDLVKRFEALELEHGDLEAVAQELADCDPQDLEDARNELATVDKSIEEKTRKLAELRQELDESVRSVEALTLQKQQYLEEIKEADKIREECRGWSSEEIRKHKGKPASTHRALHDKTTPANNTQPRQTQSRSSTAGPSPPSPAPPSRCVTSARSNSSSILPPSSIHRRRSSSSRSQTPPSAYTTSPNPHHNAHPKSNSS